MSRQLQPACGFSLVCTICGNARPFSDLSHTLTHLNSRGHLQHKHRLELQAPVDNQAQAQLDAYNVWYTTNNIARLLAERMSMAKGAKKLAKSKSKKAAKDEIKAEEPYSPPQATIKRTRPIRTTARYGQQAYDDDSDKDPSWQDDDTPSPTRHVTGYIPVSIPIDPLLSIPVEPKAKGGGPLDLKGEIHDGMDVFDSATPNTKRARNQRKKPGVLEKMKKNSAEVEPEEISYHANGEFRGVRDIFGPISTESTPDHKASPKNREPRLATKPKSVLQLKSVNRSVRIAKTDRLLTQNDRPNFEIPKPIRKGTKRTMAIQANLAGTNYLNRNMLAQLTNSTPMPNPFMQANIQKNYVAQKGPDNDWKPQTEHYDIPRVAAHEHGLATLYEAPGRYIPVGYGYSDSQGEDRGNNTVGGFGNPLSSAFNSALNFQSNGETRDQHQYGFQSQTLQPQYSHMNEQNALRGSPTPIPRPIRLKDSNNDNRTISAPQSRQRPPSPGLGQYPKAGFFSRPQAVDGRTNQFQYRAYQNDGFRHTPMMQAEHMNYRKDQGRPDYSSRHIESPRNGDFNLAQHQQSPISNPYQENNGRLRDVEALPSGDRDIKSTPRNSFHAPSSALRSAAQSSSRRSMQSASRSLYGAELDQEYDEPFSNYSIP